MRRVTPRAATFAHARDPDHLYHPWQEDKYVEKNDLRVVAGSAGSVSAWRAKNEGEALQKAAGKKNDGRRNWNATCTLCNHLHQGTVSGSLKAQLTAIVVVAQSQERCGPGITDRSYYSCTSLKAWFPSLPSEAEPERAKTRGLRGLLGAFER
jgi:hypothetical protein